MGGPCYRGWRLDRSLAEFRRAVDRLRWDTDPRRSEPAGLLSTPAPRSRPTPAPTRERQPSLGLPA